MNAQELMKLDVKQIARKFEGYGMEDVRRFVEWMAGEYSIHEPRYQFTEREIELYNQVMLWLNLQIIQGNFEDYLGEIYMAVGYPSKSAGQFFTPWSLCMMSAKMSMPASREDVLEIIKQSGDKYTVYDPACGAGAMLCAALEVARRRGYDDLIELYGQDIDLYCVLMAKLNIIMRQELPAIICSLSNAQNTQN